MKTLKLLAIAISAAIVPAAAQAAASSQASSPSTPERKPAASSKKATARTKKTRASRKRYVRRAPYVSARARAAAHAFVLEKVSSGASIPIENAAALVPFFEQLYRLRQGDPERPLHILHFGDSHTAADEWTGDLRTLFQEKFGDGGSGFSLAGHPYTGYRRSDVHSSSTRGWHTDGLVGHTPGDGIYGLGGISLTTSLPGQDVSIEAEASDFELFYYQQPGGGSLQLYDNGTPVEQVTTDGDPGAGYFRFHAEPGLHKLELETLDHAPVRLFGWVADKDAGVTYEELGINGAEASIIDGWNEETLLSNIERRSPALIVLAYGTNEAGHSTWTLDSYRDMFSHVIGRLREAAPEATILVIGPPDRDQRTRKGWLPMERVGLIIQAQREAALANGCPFWDLRAKMGGKGAMLEWVKAGMGQPDHVHFTGAGYKVLGDAVFRDLMSQYDLFLKARRNTVTDVAQQREP